jgi:RNA polymerase sigma-70 factor (ECF subfamily)
MPPERTDTELIQATLRGEQAAYEQLVRKYQERLFKAVLPVARRRVDAEDLVQEAFLRAYMSLHAFEGRSSFYTWLYRIAINLALGRRRRAPPVVWLEEVSRSAGAEPADGSEWPGERLVREERLAEVRAAVANLEAGQRAAWVLRAVHGFDYRKIGSVLGVNIGTVRSRLHRARRHLQCALQPTVEPALA